MGHRACTDTARPHQDSVLFCKLGLVGCVLQGHLGVVHSRHKGIAPHARALLLQGRLGKLRDGRAEHAQHFARGLHKSDLDHVLEVREVGGHVVVHQVAPAERETSRQQLKQDLRNSK